MSRKSYFSCLFSNRQAFFFLCSLSPRALRPLVTRRRRKPLSTNWIVAHAVGSQPPPPALPVLFPAAFPCLLQTPHSVQLVAPSSPSSIVNLRDAPIAPSIDRRRYLLHECGVDPGGACLTRGRGEGRTSLHWAARGGHEEVRCEPPSEYWQGGVRCCSALGDFAATHPGGALTSSPAVMSQEVSYGSGVRCDRGECKWSDKRGGDATCQQYGPAHLWGHALTAGPARGLLGSFAILLAGLFAFAGVHAKGCGLTSPRDPHHPPTCAALCHKQRPIFHSGPEPVPTALFPAGHLHQPNQLSQLYAPPARAHRYAAYSLKPLAPRTRRPPPVTPAAAVAETATTVVDTSPRMWPPRRGQPRSIGPVGAPTCRRAGCSSSAARITGASTRTGATWPTGAACRGTWRCAGSFRVSKMHCLLRCWLVLLLFANECIVVVY